jgi:hypothetical protein
MTKPIIRIHDISTDTVIDREMTDEEFAQYEADQAEAEARKVAEAEAKAAEEAAKQQAFNDAVAAAVAAALAAQQEPVVTEE